MNEKKIEGRVGVRLTATERQQLENLVREGRYRTISLVVRAALEEFLSKEGGAIN